MKYLSLVFVLLMSCVYRPIFVPEDVIPVEDVLGTKPVSYEMQIEHEIVRLSNQARNEPVAWDDKVSIVAREWSADQKKTGRISHDGFPYQREAQYKRLFPDYTPVAILAENVGAVAVLPSDKPTEIAQRIVRAWLNSPDHKRNIVNPTYKRIGVGVEMDDRRMYATQLFFREKDCERENCHK